jgi:hypothetical protein
MTTHKFRIGKNHLGWYVAIPQGWGGYDVIENVGSFSEAVKLFNRLTFGWSSAIEWR